MELAADLHNFVRYYKCQAADSVPTNCPYHSLWEQYFRSCSLILLHFIACASTVGVATGDGLDGRSEFEAARVKNFLHVVYTVSGTHPAFYPIYPMWTGGSFSGGKAAGVRSWPLKSN
jgi:hypothetical protein